MKVAESALIKRINRRLEGHEQLHITRGQRWRSDLGNAYITDHYSNTIVASHVNIEQLARELNALGPQESVAVCHSFRGGFE